MENTNLNYGIDQPHTPGLCGQLDIINTSSSCSVEIILIGNIAIDSPRKACINLVKVQGAVMPFRFL